MANTLTELKTAEDLDRLIEASSTEPVIIYKHSLTCGTSAMAFEEIRDLVAGSPISARVGIVMVQPARAVSNAIASRLGVRHESPQVLLLQGGQVVWQASHFRVTADAIRDALQRLASDAVS
jgi:bacillithiol system protein YtxJ